MTTRQRRQLRMPIRVLHLSDLNFRGTKRHELPSPIRLLPAFITTLVEQGLAPDLVAITGDIALSGKQAEYKAADHWIRASLLPACGIGPRSVFPVPGNHDVDRRSISPLTATVRESIIGQNSQAYATHVMRDPETREALLRPHRNYLSFALGYGEGIHSPWWRTKRTLHGHRVQLCGLCSSLLSGSGKDMGRLIITRWQLDQVARRYPDADVCIALMHHPLEFVVQFDADEANKVMHDNCDIMLHGDIHGRRQRSTRSGLLFLSATLAYREHSATTFNLIELDPDAHRTRVHSFLWHDGSWTQDTSAVTGIPSSFTEFPLNNSRRPIRPKAAPPIGPEGMFLTRISLTNVRCIEQLTLAFESQMGVPRRWTVLLGENGCGKTTLLRSIALLLAGSDAFSELVGDVSSWIRVGCDEALLCAHVRDAYGDTFDITLILRRGDDLREVFARNKRAFEFIDMAAKSNARQYFFAGYGCSRRLSQSAYMRPSATDMFRAQRAQGVSSLFDADAILHSVPSWASDLRLRWGERGIAVVQRALSGLLPGVALESIDEHDLHFTTPDGKVPLAHLSDGYQNIVAWLGDLVYRSLEVHGYEDSPLITRGVLLIDELDLHLHPKWQRLLRHFLDKQLGHVQFITTTHSALTAQQCGEGELYVMERRRPHISPTLVPVAGTPKKLLVQQLLASPAFGLESMYSEESERLRREWRRLRNRTVLTNRAKRRLTILRSVLADSPDPEAMDAVTARHTKVLQRVLELIEDGRQSAKRPSERRSHD